jgi:WhiB family transcriptional regulator, redox-sensing transcriptional regulator
MAPLGSPARPTVLSIAPPAQPATRAARPRKGPDSYLQPEDDWQERGSCRGENPSLFFAPDHESPHQRRLRETAAKTICSRCPVRTACRAYALETGELYGIWGGTTERERARPQTRSLRPGSGARTAKAA